MFNTPVLLIIYNRIEETHNLFQIIREIAPSQLYVAADGPNPNVTDDYKKCLRTRCVIKPEWQCDQHNFFKEEHLGKTQMAYQSISWFFEHVEEGIILFDDTLPHADFFPFCEQLLEKYRNHNDVMHIAGSNFQKKHIDKRFSYYFSAYSYIWGFATWRRAWNNFDLSLQHIENNDFKSYVDLYIKRNKSRKRWMHIFNILKNHNLNYWEFQYNFHIWKNSGYSIIPSKNLIKNVGFSKGRRNIRKLMRNTQSILPLRHPEGIRLNLEADHRAYKKVFKRATFRVFRQAISHAIGIKPKI